MRRTSSQSKKFTLERRTRIGLFSTLVVVGCGSLIYFCSLIASWSAITISQVNVSGTDREEAEQIEESALASLRGDYLGIFARANSFLYPRSGIRQAIRSTYPAVATAVVARQGLKALSITIEEKHPAALVCVAYPDFDGNDLVLTDPGTCYFADATGYIFKKAPSFSGTVYHTYYIPELAPGTSTTDSVIGTYATSTDEFLRIEKFYSGVVADGIRVDAMFMKEGGEYELYARNQSRKGDTEDIVDTVVIYFNATGSIDEQLTNLISFWNHMKTVRPVPRFSDIKLQYPPNVYYTVSS